MLLRSLVCLLALIPALAAPAQTKSSTSANVRTGTIVSLDQDAATLTLLPKSGPTLIYRLTEKTQILRGKKRAETSAFKAGDAVVVRFRKSSVGPPTLYDLADKESWEWLARIRKETTQVTV